MKPSAIIVLVFIFCCSMAPTFGQEPASPVVSSFEDLTASLSRLGINHQKNDEQQFVLMTVENENFKAAQVIRWAAPDGVVHFIQVIPLRAPEENLPAIESSILRLNHIYPVPGLGVNHETNALYFRMTVPLAPRGHLRENEVKDYISYCVRQAIQFTPTLTEVAQGRISPKDVLEYHRKKLDAALGPIGLWKKSFAGSEWTLLMKLNGEVTLRKDGEVMVDSMVKAEGDKFTFEDVNGAMAADEPGTYQISITDGKLSFQVVEDPSQGRQQLLTGEAWVR